MMCAIKVVGPGVVAMGVECAAGVVTGEAGCQNHSTLELPTCC